MVEHPVFIEHKHIDLDAASIWFLLEMLSSSAVWWIFAFRVSGSFRHERRHTNTLRSMATAHVQAKKIAILVPHPSGRA